MCCLWLLYRGTPFEPFPDSLSPEEILEQAQGAAKEARQELSMRKPKTDVSSHGVLLHGATGAICWCDVTHSRLAQSVWRCDLTHSRLAQSVWRCDMTHSRLAQSIWRCDTFQTGTVRLLMWCDTFQTGTVHSKMWCDPFQTGRENNYNNNLDFLFFNALPLIHRDTIENRLPRGTWYNKKAQKPNIISSAQYIKQKEKKLNTTSSALNHIIQQGTYCW